MYILAPSDSSLVVPRRTRPHPGNNSVWGLLDRQCSLTANKEHRGGEVSYVTETLSSVLVLEQLPGEVGRAWESLRCAICKVWVHILFLLACLAIHKVQSPRTADEVKGIMRMHVREPATFDPCECNR